MIRRLAYLVVTAFLMGLLLARPTAAQEENLSLLPIWPLNFDVVISNQTFAPKNHEIELQAGFTALWYRDLEVRAQYRYFHLEEQDMSTTQHSCF